MMHLIKISEFRLYKFGTNYEKRNITIKNSLLLALKHLFSAVQLNMFKKWTPNFLFRVNGYYILLQNCVMVFSCFALKFLSIYSYIFLVMKVILKITNILLHKILAIFNRNLSIHYIFNLYHFYTFCHLF